VARLPSTVDGAAWTSHRNPERCDPMNRVDAAGPGVVVFGDGVVARRIMRLLGERAYRTAPQRATALADVGPDELAILAGGGAHAPVAEQLGRQGVSAVSIADAVTDIVEMRALDGLFVDNACSLVVGAAMAPGLSGLLARYLRTMVHDCDEIHTAIHATAGPSCARQHHRALAGRAIGWTDGDWVYRPGGSGRELCWFPEPVGAHDCYRGELADPVLMHADFDDVPRISARMSATRRDRLTSRLPMLRTPHREGGVGALRVEVRGSTSDGARRTLIAGVAEFVGAAAAATAVAMVAAIQRGGVPHGAVATSHGSLDHRRILSDVSDAGIRLQEFTGVSGPS